MNSGVKSGSGLLRRDEEMTREQVVPGELGVDAQRHAIAFVGADVAVQRVGFPFREIGRHAIPERVELGSSIAWFASFQSMCASLDGSRTKNLSLGERPVCGRVSTMSWPSCAEYAFAARERMLDELGNR